MYYNECTRIINRLTNYLKLYTSVHHEDLFTHISNISQVKLSVEPGLKNVITTNPNIYTFNLYNPDNL